MRQEIVCTCRGWQNCNTGRRTVRLLQRLTLHGQDVTLRAVRLNIQLTRHRHVIGNCCILSFG